MVWRLELNKRENQLKANKEVLELLNQFGAEMRIALSTSAPQNVIERVIETGMEIYWWNPMYDDPEDVNGITQKIFKMNNLPCLNAGGNVGTLCWVLADVVLGKKRVAITGMDLAYAEDLPYSRTQKYYEFVELVGEENLNTVFTKFHNTVIDKWYYSDPVFEWYKNCFLEMVNETTCETYNCSEGGMLLGKGMNFVPLSDFFQIIST